MTIIMNYNRSTALERLIINYWMGRDKGSGGGDARGRGGGLN